VGQHRKLVKTQSYGYTEHNVFYAVSNGTNHVVPVIANKIIKLILFREPIKGIFGDKIILLTKCNKRFRDENFFV
jgi:hypothetical protein